MKHLVSKKEFDEMDNFQKWKEMGKVLSWMFTDEWVEWQKELMENPPKYNNNQEI